MNLFQHKIVFYRSSHQKCSMKKGALINFTKFIGKHLCQSLSGLRGWNFIIIFYSGTGAFL